MQKQKTLYMALNFFMNSCTFKSTQMALGYDPVKVGKDVGNWQTLYMRVMVEAMTMK